VFSGSEEHCLHMMETIENSVPTENNVNQSTNLIDEETIPFAAIDNSDERQTDSNMNNSIDTGQPAVVDPILEGDEDSSSSSDSEEIVTAKSPIGAFGLSS
jgi:hypothetical protein